MPTRSDPDKEAAREFDSKHFLKQLTERPGVYRMYGSGGSVLYVGKARNLKKRVGSYFRKTGLAPKTEALVARIDSIEVTITGSETEALLLEQNLIKSLRPPYNILLRDDKSYPYIYLSSHSDYPSLTFRRGRTKKGGGTWFGPFPSSGAVKESLNILQKVFRIRSCTESFFRNRARPCLQYQINRCTAPCVGYISPEDYQKGVLENGKRKAMRIWLSSDVLFAAGADGRESLTPDGRARIDSAMATYLRYVPANPIVIEGYATGGSVADRFQQSRQRASAG